MYPTVKTKVPIYGWTIEYRESTMRETMKVKLFTGETAEAELASFVFGKLVSWDCVYPDGSPVPFHMESLYELPKSALSHIYQAVTGIIDPDKEDGSKKVSG